MTEVPPVSAPWLIEVPDPTWRGFVPGPVLFAFVPEWVAPVLSENGEIIAAAPLVEFSAVPSCPVLVAVGYGALDAGEGKVFGKPEPFADIGNEPVEGAAESLNVLLLKKFDLDLGNAEVTFDGVWGRMLLTFRDLTAEFITAGTRDL